MPCPKTGGREGAVGLFLVASGEADEAVEVVGETGSDDVLPKVGRDEREDLIVERWSEVVVSEITLIRETWVLVGRWTYLLHERSVRVCSMSAFRVAPGLPRRVDDGRSRDELLFVVMRTHRTCIRHTRQTRHDRRRVCSISVAERWRGERRCRASVRRVV